MAGAHGRRWRNITVVLTCTAACLIGQFLVFIGLYGLGFLIPYVYADAGAPVPIVLGVGIGMVLAGILVLGTTRSVLAAWMLAGGVLVPFGVSLVVTACYYGVPSTPIGASAGPRCEPGLSLVGFELSAIGVGLLVVGVILRRPRAN